MHEVVLARNSAAAKNNEDLGAAGAGGAGPARD